MPHAAPSRAGNDSRGCRSMKLRRKVFFALALAAALLIALLELVVGSTIAGGFEKVEQDLVMRDLQRTKDAIEQRVTGIKYKALERSHWDGLWKAMGRSGQAFAKKYLGSEAAQAVDVNTILLYADGGKQVYALNIDRATGRAVPHVDRLDDVLRNQHLTDSADRHPGPRSGILAIGNQALMYAALPILQSDGEGPQHGMLIMGRWVDAAEMRAVSQMTHLTMSGSSSVGTGLPHDPEQTGRLLAGPGMEVIATNDSSCRGYVRIDDISGRPALIAVVRSQREVYAQGQRTILWLVAAIFFLGVALAGVIWVTLERTVLSRLQKLSREVASITVGKLDHYRVDDGAPDELGDLARTINATLGTQEEAEAELRKFYLLIENSEDFVAMAHVDGSITYVNTAGRKLIGMRSDEDATCKTVFDFYPADLHSFVRNTLLPDAVERGAWEGETRFQRKAGGDDILMHQSVFLVSDPATGRPICFATIARDITASRKAAAALAQARDEALASTRAKATFLANMSHEIRTPMNGVIGMTELLFDTHLSEEQRDYAGIIRTSAEALLSVINGILDFSKIEAGKMQIEDVDFNLRSVLEEVSFLLATKALGKQLELVCHIPPGIPEQLRGDPTRIRQIAMNLLGNAIKFTEQGEIVLQARVLKESRSEALVRISVKDTGIGIPEDRRHAIFDSFTQADGSSSRRYGGTGLGLTICKQLTELMHGQISVESAPGVGTTFSVDIPFKKQAGAVSSTEPGFELLKGMRALIVDDNGTNRLILREYMKAWGCRTEEAERGAEAIELLKADAATDPYHIVLLDMQMPDMDGEETAKLIRAEPNINDVGIMLLTSMGSVGSHSENADAHFNATLVKPIHQSQLYSALHAMMNRQGGVRAPELRAADTSATLSGLSILLVEDNAVNQKVASRILERFGCAVVLANNGVEALKALSSSSIDLVLMDCQMPEMDGYEATREIRRCEVGTHRHLPIIAMTAGALEGDKDKCLAAGMDAYVSKPVKPQELLESILPWVGRSLEAAPQATSALEVLDATRLDDVCGNDLEFKAEVVNEFIAGLGSQLAEIRAAIECGDCAALASSAHSLKGSTRTIGGVSAASACEELEVCGRQGVNAGLEEILSRTEAEFKVLKDALLKGLPKRAA
jgi:PAS domain S-box-containing protein